MITAPDFEFEKSLTPNHCRYILGIDEVGRGPWAGPVAVGAFLLDINNFDEIFFKNSIKDSKMLSFEKRNTAYQEINTRQFSYKVLFVEPAEIDSIGIQKAIYQSIENLIHIFSGQYDYALIDGNMKFENQSLYKSVVKGDGKCFSIASASICAKVERDNEMIRLSKLYPGYDFENNKGYGTPNHVDGLKRQGTCPIHRKSYKPVKNFISF